MILNHKSSQTKRGLWRYAWRRSVGVFWKYSSMLHVFSISTLCFVSTFSLRGIILNGTLWSGGID